MWSSQDELIKFLRIPLQNNWYTCDEEDKNIR